jgi:hypothetical protein
VAGSPVAAYGAPEEEPMHSTERTQIRKLSILEVDCVSGGEFRLDFGIVVIDLMFASIETGMRAS